MLRRTLLLNALGGTLALMTGGMLQARESGTVKPRKAKIKSKNIRIHASKFVYSPNRITINQGDKVTLELTSSDAVHGFSIPDLNVRSDIPPGQVILLTITAPQAGELMFLCDNFCGDGHEKMQGKITVLAKS